MNNRNWAINSNCGWCKNKLVQYKNIYFICDVACCSPFCAANHGNHVMNYYDRKFKNPYNWPKAK